MNIPIMLASTGRNFWDWVIFLLQVGGHDLLMGAEITLLLALTGTVIGCIIGFLVGVVQTIPVEPQDLLIKKVILKIVRCLLSAYVEVFRGTPMIVQAVVIYYGSMQMLGIDMSALLAGFVVVSINTGAYM